jgi:hypothetical protein
VEKYSTQKKGTVTVIGIPGSLSNITATCS